MIFGGVVVRLAKAAAIDAGLALAIVNNADFAVVKGAVMALPTSAWRPAVDQRCRGCIDWQPARCNTRQHTHSIFGKVIAVHAQFNT